jgi:opacity protein-like surface antigen
MKKNIIFVAAIAALMVPSLCSATPPRPGPYVSGFAGISVPRDAEADTTDFDTGSTFHDSVEFDPGAYAGGTAGFDFGFLRLEGELSYRYSEIKSVTDRDANYSFHDVDGNLGALSMMANAFFDLHNPSPITPYVGGGIGFAVLHMGDTTGVDTRGSSPERVLLYPEDDNTVFAYQVGAGMEIALNPRISLDVGYRYFGTDNARFESGYLSTSNVKLESHNAMVGVRVKF